MANYNADSVSMGRGIQDLSIWGRTKVVVRHIDCSGPLCVRSGKRLECASHSRSGLFPNHCIGWLLPRAGWGALSGGLWQRFFQAGIVERRARGCPAHRPRGQRKLAITLRALSARQARAPIWNEGTAWA